MKILVVVDMQNDFIDGALGSVQAQKIVENVKNKIENFDGKIIFTQDTHSDNYLDTQEGKNLPVRHCIKDTDGHKINPSLNTKDCEVIEKPSFGSPVLIQRLLDINKVENIEQIVFVGLCTDICVISNAMTVKTFLPEVKITVDSSCCAGVSEKSHNTALDAMRACQIEII
ncbi:isochorismatase family protein [[Eubacterium] yurii subsp. margaretiae ATCC 43715]|nr:isochorismatase family protein [[Eubacterium] yurii subsp. margaretiae ATCC 43715]